jgi:hypothetical protein
MKLSYKKKGYVISEIDATQMISVTYLLGIIRDKCFQEELCQGGRCYYSGNDFFAVLTKRELDALHALVDDLRKQINL